MSWGVKAAGIAEVDPGCAVPMVSALECALVDEAKNIWPVPGGLLDEIIGSDAIEVIYRCGFGMNPDHVHVFAQSDLIAEAINESGAVQAMALRGHPFCLGCAFQPERAALNGHIHPIVAAFFKAVQRAAQPDT